ncbi:hypothetical protein [Pedobacter faecalis]|uniref:hypothetical protein n=1 Tax=Pedobacter faecalis TaxID=3041495 RepID=UPI00254EE048|nr:hypothetical protein [Pedobacter sp. ELA7]
MELMIPHECRTCGAVDEAKFVYAGPHIKQVCNACNKYVKFYGKGQMPDVREVKIRIWAITQDTARIESAKKEVGFVSDPVGPEAKMLYWRLYLKLREQSGKEAGL